MLILKRCERGLKCFRHVSDRFSDPFSRFSNHFSYQFNFFRGKFVLQTCRPDLEAQHWQQRCFSYRAILVVVVSQKYFVLVLDGIAQKSRDTLQNRVSHRCAPVKTQCQGGASHHFGGVLTSQYCGGFEQREYPPPPAPRSHHDDPSPPLKASVPDKIIARPTPGKNYPLVQVT